MASMGEWMTNYAADYPSLKAAGMNELLERQARLHEVAMMAALRQQDWQVALGQTVTASPSPYKAKEECMLDKLKNVAGMIAAKGAVEGLVELAAYGRGLRTEYEVSEIPAPKWLTEALETLSREIKARYRAEKEARARTLEKEIEELKSREEKRAAKQAELEELRKTLT